MRGRRPKPEAIKDLEGRPGKQRRRHGVKPPPGKAIMPDVVAEDLVARAEWERLGPQLELLGLLSPVDQQTFAGYCLAYSMFVQAKRQLVTDGFVYKTSSGQIKKHPILDAMMKAGAEMRKFGIEHGITPSSRTKVTPLSPQPTLPGVPEKPQHPNAPEEAVRFFGNAKTLQ
jgi:P27 family predicted phage terminase small subunit